MYTNPQKLAAADTIGLRREAGRWLRERREKQGLSQRQLAEKVGTEYYTFISQLEAGRGRIPPEKYKIWARAFAMKPRDLVLNLLPYYDPVTYDILFAESDDERVTG